MSIVAITGDHPRHAHVVRCLAGTGLLKGWVIERREAFVPELPAGLTPGLADLFRRHFSLRDAAERQFFGDTLGTGADIPTLEVTLDNLNGADTVAFLKQHASALVLSYGCHKLSAAVRAAVPARFWNTHGGLSPEYRGVITHFWPSYFLEPQMTGMTLHETTDHIDGGAILHQTAAQMVRGDGLHWLAARTVHDYGHELARRLAGLDFEALPKGVAQKTSGRVFRGADWRPEHLRLIYEVHEDRMVDAVLDGRVEGRTPEIVSVL